MAIETDPRTGVPVAEVTDRAIAVCTPDFISAAELEGFRPLTSWWYEALWESAAWAVRNGKLLVLSVESGEAEAVKVAALFHLGRVLFKHDPGKGRLYIMADPAAAEDDATDGDARASAARPIDARLARECVSVLRGMSTDTLRAAVETLLQHDQVQPDTADRDALLDLAGATLTGRGTLELIAIRETLLRRAGEERDDERDGESAA